MKLNVPVEDKNSCSENKLIFQEKLPKNYRSELTPKWEDAIASDLLLESKKKFVCKSCEEMILKAKFCEKCDQNICQSCIRSHSRNEEQCPVCFRDSLIDIDEDLLQVFRNFKFRCRNFPVGCQQILDYNQFSIHLSNCVYYSRFQKGEGIVDDENKKRSRKGQCLDFDQENNNKCDKSGAVVKNFFDEEIFKKCNSLVENGKELVSEEKQRTLLIYSNTRTNIWQKMERIKKFLEFLTLKVREQEQFFIISCKNCQKMVCEVSQKICEICVVNLCLMCARKGIKICRTCDRPICQKCFGIMDICKQCYVTR